MTQELPQISTPDAVLRIKRLIEKKIGDQGRLEYISERLQNGKKLFHSDEIYLNNKISATVIPIQIKKLTDTDKKIKYVKNLIKFNFGEPDRLNYILHVLQGGRKLYHSDERYIDFKIKQFTEFTEGKRLRKIRSKIIKPESNIPQPSPRDIEEQPSSGPYEDISEKFQDIEEAVLPQDTKSKSDLFDLIDEGPKVDLEIQRERERISKLKHNHEQIKIQHDELSQLIAYRQEYEVKINNEKEILEKEIKIEQERVKEKDALVADLIKNQSKLLQSKSEREVLLEQIKIDKEKSEKDLSEMQKELEELKIEYEELKKDIETRKQNLEDKIKDQKEKMSRLKEDSEEP